MDVPRRNRIDQHTPAEKAICDAQVAVEALPADARLTKAGMLLQQARDAVADFVEGVDTTPEPKKLGDVEHILQFFTWAHLPPHLAEVSRPFAEIAHTIVENLPRNPERTVALRKLLESKDAAVRARVAK